MACPQKGKIYKFQCSNNTQFMGTSKFTHWAHTWHAPKKEKYTNSNVTQFMAMTPKRKKYLFQCFNNTQFMGTSKFTHWPTWHDPKKENNNLFQCSNNTQFMGTSKFTHMPPKRKNIQIPMF